MENKVEKVPFDTFFIATPMRMPVVGPSAVGKSEFILKLVENRDKLFQNEFSRIFFAYPASDQTEHRHNYLGRLKNICPTVEIIEDLPDLAEASFTGKHHVLLIADDLGIYQHLTY